MEDTGLTFSEFRDQLDKRGAFYRDEYMSAKTLNMNSINGKIVQVKQVAAEVVTKEFELLPWGLQTMCSKLGIPHSYAKKCPPHLRATNFNYWLEAQGSTELFMRLDGYPDGVEKIRAVLSRRYADFPNTMLAKMLEDNIDDKYAFTVSYNDDGCRLLGDIVSTAPEYSDDSHAGAIHMANSEIGTRKLSFETMVNFKALSSGIIIGELGGFKEKHIGDKKILADEFKASMEEIMNNYSNAIKGLIDLKQVQIEDAEDMLTFIGDANKLTIGQNLAIKKAMTSENPKTLYDIITVVVRASIDPEVSYDDREVLQRVGGKITMNAKRYKRWQVKEEEAPTLERSVL